ncbi:PTS sugar transporter subunit IIA [Couchioplanes caeruleus]|uniref:Mannitol-specific phosphotransferase enzyme IIA component n=2 Tax=Couchioplanes caeruleus TaxID=56438 RepID=A0A1K0FMK4_9ACTN|nr:PTS sugar transporter subunit IIA [Couchioplanes caeruleus]OJF14025.1 PTS sugar transporter subunit IIA [Couchioplanes caeruleus subsp. caeruleus]ROP30549.1 PTS system IIA component (Fru family) [Couchioplanes caeruleus]
MRANLRPVLQARGVRVHERAADRVAAIHRCADVLEEIGAVHPAYREAMLDREWAMSTYLGEGVAIPHGLDMSRALVRHDSIVVLRFPEGVDWDGDTVTVCVAIAARGDGHVELLAALAQILLDPARARALREAGDPETVIALFRDEEQP